MDHYVYILNGEFADILPPDDDLPHGEGPVDPNVEDAPAWQFGNEQQQHNQQNPNWGAWEDNQGGNQVDEHLMPLVPQLLIDLQASSASSLSTYPSASSAGIADSAVSISTDEQALTSPDKSIVVHKDSVHADLYNYLCERFPHIMFDKHFTQDSSFWAALSIGPYMPGESSSSGQHLGYSQGMESELPVLMLTHLVIVPPVVHVLPAPVKSPKIQIDTPITTVGLRRSSRLSALNDGHKDEFLTQLDPNQGIGKPRGKSVKKLKQVAKEVGLLFSGCDLQDSDFEEGSTTEAASGAPADCSCLFCKKMAVDLCGASAQEVSQIDLLKTRAPNESDGNN